MRTLFLLLLLTSVVGCGKKATEERAKQDAAESAKAEELRQLIAKADAVWESDDKPTAAEMYAEIMRNWPLDNVPKLREMVQRGEEFDSAEENAKSMAAQENRPAIGRIYERLIDFSVEQGNLELARQLAQQAGKDRFFDLSPATPQGKEIFAKAEAERSAESLEGWAELERQGIIGNPKSSSRPSQTGPTEEQLDRRTNAIAADLKKFTSEAEMRNWYGPPDVFEQSSVRKNMYLIAWKRTRRSGEEEYLAVVFIKRVDGQTGIFVVNGDTYRSLDRLKSLLNKSN